MLVVDAAELVRDGKVAKHPAAGLFCLYLAGRSPRSSLPSISSPTARACSSSSTRISGTGTHPCPHHRKEQDMNKPRDTREQGHYPVADWIPAGDLEALGLRREKDGTLKDARGRRVHPSRIKAALTGEKRPPKEGEWFVSRTSLTAHLATSDLVVAENVARLVLV